MKQPISPKIKGQTATSIISNAGQTHLSPTKSAVKSETTNMAAHKLTTIVKPDILQTSAANVFFIFLKKFKELAQIEAAKVAERERQKKEKLASFQESLKAKLKETVKAKKEEKNKAEEQKMLEEQKKQKLMSTFNGIKLKKKGEPQNVQTNTEPVIRTMNPKMIENVIELKNTKHMNLSTKEKYSPVYLLKLC